MPTMLSVLEDEAGTLDGFSSHVDSSAITVVPPSPSNKPLKTFAEIQTLLQQGRKQDVKVIIRNNGWPVNHPIRAQLWPMLCGQHHNSKSSDLDGFYWDMVNQVFGSTELPDKSVSLPPFVEPSHCQAYYLTHRGRSIADRVVSVLGYACPDIVYSPSLYPICALLLHFMSEEECYHCMTNLVASKEKMFITQTKLLYEVTWKTVMQIAKKHVKAAAVHLQRHCSTSRVERIYIDWIWWILQDMPFAQLVRVMDCFFHEGIKVFYRVAMAILILFHKSSTASNSEWMSEIQKNGVDIALTKFCKELPVLPQKVLKVAFGIRGLSSAYILRVFMRTEMVLKSKTVISGSRQLIRSRSTENLPNSQSQNNIQMVSHTLTIREAEPSKRRKTWNKEQMLLAIKTVRQHDMGYKTASKHFGVPKGTLERYVKQTNLTPEEAVNRRSGKKPTLNKEIEAELVQYCLKMDERFFGLRRSDVKRMAFELAIANNIRHPFSNKNGTAGKKWLRGFLKRHPELSIRSPQGMSNARIRGFNKENVATFFELYEKELDKINFEPHLLYNVDETGISVVQHKRNKIISARGKKQVATLTSAERGGLITVVTCMNAVGTYVPPLIVWPRKNMKHELMDGAPAGSIYACHPSGWIQTDIFTRWFDHFIKFTKPTASQPVLLVLDGHYSHTRNIEVINKARDNHISIVCLPPHSTHRMQPLDVGFMGPFKTYYAQEIETWLRNHPDRIVTPFIIARLFSGAYNRAATMEVSVNSFRKTGLYPFNKHIFRDHDLTIFEDEKEFTDIENISTQPQIETLNDSDEDSSPVTLKDSLEVEQSRPGTSSNSSDVEQAPPWSSPKHSHLLTVTKYVSPVQIKSLPKVLAKKPSARAGSAALITSSPYKDQLIASLDKKRKRKPPYRKNVMKVTKRVKFEEAENLPSTSKIIRNQKKKTVSDSSSDESDSEVIYNDDSDDADYDAECLFCTNLYSADKHGEQWVKCTKCNRWAHEDCGADGANFICPMCEKMK